MCDALIRAGAHPGVYNKHGQTIFNVPAATKHLLFRILGKGLYLYHAACAVVVFVASAYHRVCIRLVANTVHVSRLFISIFVVIHLVWICDAK